MKSSGSNRAISVDLSKYDNSWYSPGRGRIVCSLWYFCNVIFFRNPLNPFSKIKILILRVFGAQVGEGVVIKPSVNIKYPWKIEIGDYTWIGESVWLDSLGGIKIGRNVCVSQGVYLCTGNHDWSDYAFGLMVRPIQIENGAWLGAKSIVLPGVTIAENCVVTAGRVVRRDTRKNTIIFDEDHFKLRNIK